MSTPTQTVHDEMIQELLCRRVAALQKKATLMALSSTIADVDARVAAIDAELAEYGYKDALPGATMPA